MKLLRPTCAWAVTISILALSAPVAAIAQYVWLDEKGGKHYSDMPPPATIPNNRILKAPGASRAVPPSNPETQASSQANDDSIKAASKPAAPKTMAEKNADFVKRKTEQAEKEKKSADEAKRLAEKNKNCERIREYQRALDSGQRIAQTDKYGERVIMNDEQRAQESRDTKQMLAECK